MTDKITEIEKEAPRTSHWVWGNLALVAIYLAAGKTGFFLTMVKGSVVPVWFPTGLAVAALLVWGWRLWPGVFLGAFFLSLTTTFPWPASLGIAIGNTVQGVLAAWLVRRFAGGVKAFDRTGTVFKFVTLAALVSPLVSAAFGVMSLCSSGSA